MFAPSWSERFQYTPPLPARCLPPPQSLLLCSRARLRSGLHRPMGPKREGRHHDAFLEYDSKTTAPNKKTLASTGCGSQSCLFRCFLGGVCRCFLGGVFRCSLGGVLLVKVSRQVSGHGRVTSPGTNYNRTRRVIT